MVTFFRRRDRRYIKSASVKPRPRFRPLLEALEIRINPNTTYIVPPPVVENGVLTNGSSTVSGLGTTTGLFVGEGVTAAGQNFNGTLTNGSTSVTNVGTTNLFVGESLTGTGIQSGTTIAAFNSATKTITLSQAAVATGQEQLTPSGIPAGTTIASINAATKSVTLSNAAVATGQQSITFADSNPLASTPFNESEALAGVTLIASNANAGGVTTLEAYYADEHALSGIANPLPGVPGHVSNPTLVSGTDASGRPVAPVLYITDMSIASNVLSDGTGIGDWENGGTPVGPNDVFGTWKGPATASDPATNPNWNLGPGSDAPPSTFVSDNYGAEIRWNLNTLIDPATGKPLVAGDSYRFMVIDHDGDQNKTGGDTGFAIFVMPGLITTASPAVTLGTTAPTLSDSAVLSGGTSPTGTLTFKLFSPSHTLVYTDVVSVNGNGTYNTNSSGTPAGGNTLPKTGTVTGTYTWQVSYSGDANNAPATDQGGAQEQTVVSAANPTLVTMAGPTVTVGDGNKLTDTADLEGGYFPTGSITFTLYDSNNNVVDTETVTGINGDGKYTSPGFVPTTAGQYHWAATYNFLDTSPTAS